MVTSNLDKFWLSNDNDRNRVSKTQNVFLQGCVLSGTLPASPVAKGAASQSVFWVM